MKEVMHVDEFIFNYCVSSMISDDIPETSTESAMNVFSIDENKIRDANGIIFAEAITCYKCTFCGKMFAAMEVVLTHYQSNHRCSVIPLLKGITKTAQPRAKPGPKLKYSKNPKEPYGPIKPRPNVLAESTATNEAPPLLRDSTKSVSFYDKNENNKKFKCHYPGCPKSFSYRIGLETHQKSHKKLKSYKCDWNDCKFKCSDLAGLNFHKNTHSGEKPYKCVWPGCGQSFPDSATKDEHLQKEHIKDRLLECDYVGCSEKFMSANDRDIHSSTHTARRKPRHNSGNTSKNGKGVGKGVSNSSGGKRVGRPPKKRPVVEETSSSDESESSDDNNEDNENFMNDDNKGIANNSQTKEDPKNEQPLDLSKTALNLSTDSIAMDLSINSSKEQKTSTENKTPAKRGRKRKKSKEKSIQKTVFRCDYPGCRKTFPDGDVLHEHEKEAHHTASEENRSRYERRCKGNLYYKL